MHHNFVSQSRTPANGDSEAATMTAPFHASARAAVESSPAPQMNAALAEIRELRAEVEQIRAERNRLAETQRRIMELLNVQSPDKLVHDIRNVLNERELLKALVGDL